MGRRGPKGKSGVGHITPKGYRRVWCPIQRRQVMQHVLVWETHNGPVPPKMQVHHINEDKLDNRIENLRLMSALEHKRHHGGCEVRDGVEYKPCRKCGTFHPVEHYYKRRDAISPWCRPCCIANAIENKRKRKAAKVAAQA